MSFLTKRLQAAMSGEAAVEPVATDNEPTITPDTEKEGSTTVTNETQGEQPAVTPDESEAKNEAPATTEPTATDKGTETTEPTAAITEPAPEAAAEATDPVLAKLDAIADLLGKLLAPATSPEPVKTASVEPTEPDEAAVKQAELDRVNAELTASKAAAEEAAAAAIKAQEAYEAMLTRAVPSPLDTRKDVPLGDLAGFITPSSLTEKDAPEAGTGFVGKSLADFI